MSIRSRFDNELELLNDDLAKMGAMIEESIDNSILVLENNDEELAEKIVQTDKYINKMETEIEARALKLLLRQQPVASDLRLISTALKMITDMERIGDHAADIAATAFEQSKKNKDKVVYLFDDNIKQMAALSTEMINLSVEAFVKESQSLANTVIAKDDIMDDLFMKERDIIIKQLKDDSVSPDAAVNTLMIVKYFERIGDHATNIAEWVIFYLTGEHKDAKII